MKKHFGIGHVSTIIFDNVLSKVFSGHKDSPLETDFKEAFLS